MQVFIEMVNHYEGTIKFVMRWLTTMKVQLRF